MAKTNQGKPSVTIGARLTKCRRSMAKDKVKALLITNPTDYYYLTGFTGEDSAVLITARDVHLVSDGRFNHSIDSECPWARKWMRKGLLHAEIATVAKQLGLRSMAVQSGHLTVDAHAELKRACRGCRLTTALPVASTMRQLKDADELKTMRRAIRVAEDAFCAMLASIRLGDTEIELAARLEYEMKRRGSTEPSFPTIVAEGPNAAHPHAKPGRRKIKRGSAVLFDWGARIDGYCSDLTRVVFIGSMPAKLAEVYKVVLDAQERAIAAIRAQARMCDVDAVARDAIKAAGYGDAFNHGLGHGLGLDVHEAPSLSWRSQAKLVPGMVVTVEPGIYLPGIGGVRIEDDVLVTSSGRRVLSRIGKQLKDAIVPARRERK